MLPREVELVSYLQPSELGRRGDSNNARASKRQRRDSNPGSLDLESGLLPLSTVLNSCVQIYKSIHVWLISELVQWGTGTLSPDTWSHPCGNTTSLNFQPWG